MIGIINYVKKLFSIIGLLICFEFVEVVCPEEANAGFNSLLERESQVYFSGFVDFVVKLVENIYICFYRDVIYNLGQLNETCIPRIITSDSSYEKDCDGSNGNPWAVGISAAGLALFIVSLVAVILTAWIPIVGQAIFLAAVVVLASVIMSCLGMYVLAPHEYINALYGNLKTSDCKEMGNQIVNNNPNAITQTDVPFFYNCADSGVDKDKLASQVKVGDLSGLSDITGYGNMEGPSMPYCQPDGSRQYALNILKDKSPEGVLGIKPGDIKPGAIIVGLVGGKYGIISQIIALFTRSRCDIAKDDITLFNSEDIRKGGWELGDFKPVPYYRLYGGKIQLCAANISMFLGALIAGCTYIAPPIEAIPIEAGFTDKTRCSYFMSSRTDLNSLGASINNDSVNGNYEPVGLFLKSDFHIMSTVVGCIQDLLIKVVVGGTEASQESLLYKIQENLKRIVLAVLVLYISLLGIKIISNPNPPQISEVVMYILKFAAVIVISGVYGNSIWYNGQDKSNPGLYKMLLDSMNDLAGIVLQSADNIAPVNMCYYKWNNGKNLLSEMNIPASGKLVPTVAMLNEGQVKLSVWDFVDCKLASYLSLNSCKYTMSGMISMWMISVCIFLPSIFLLGITTIIFSIVLFVTMLRFVHLSIVSMFALTILVLVSPIISCFLLFDYTKETFKTWFKMLLGYILYPAMIFSFIALMTATFDSIFYGQIPEKNKDCLKQKDGCTMEQICGTSKSDNSSIYCTIIRAASTEIKDPISPRMCNVKSGQILNALTQSYDIKLLGVTIFSIKALKDILFEDVFIGIAKMLLFVILFYNMTNSIISFFETLLQIYGIGDLAPSYGGVGRKLFGLAAKVSPVGMAKGAISAGSTLKNMYKNTRPKT